MGHAFFLGTRSYEQPHGTYQFTQTGSWTVPDGVTKVKIYLVGAGGNGGANAWTNNDKSIAGGGGGGGGGLIVAIELEVTANAEISAIIGYSNTIVTALGNTYTAQKGNNGTQSINGGHGGDGQSGGGGGSYNTSSGDPYKAENLTNGGTNGSDGETGYDFSRELNNQGHGNGGNCYIEGVLFSSGGRGGMSDAHNRAWQNKPCNNGTPNTGNGADGRSAGYDGNNVSGGVGATGTAILVY